MVKKAAIVSGDDDAGKSSAGFPEKWLKKIKHWVDTANSMTDEELKKAIVDCEGNIYTIEKEKEANIPLKAAKEVLKDLGSSFRDANATQMAKIKYSLFLLENRGIELDNNEPKV